MDILLADLDQRWRDPAEGANWLDIRVLELFAARYPGLIDRVDFGPHERHVPAPQPDQLAMFE
jgi:hypothetical protein